ncbi:MAG: phosphotyrosine protein phosphatase [Rubrivivax sp.]|nr:MAG: phosphotyrosine protein phosphatase [Rubrivivax sp.]
MAGAGSTLQGPGRRVSERQKVLFICSRNQWRSPTAEQVFCKHPALAVRSAGTSASARRHVSDVDLAWADVNVVMENKHKSRLLQHHAELLAGKAMHVLDIPDDYPCMDPELVELLEGAVPALLGLR